MNEVRVEEVLALAVRADAWGQKWLADRLYESVGAYYYFGGCGPVEAGVKVAEKFGITVGAVMRWR